MAFFWVSLVAAAIPTGALVDDVPWPIRLRQDIEQVGRLQWRMRQAAGTACATEKTDIGVVFDHRRAYEKTDWDLLEKTLGMTDLPVVAGVALGSPASDAGVLPGDAVISISSISVAEIINAKRTDESFAELFDRWVSERPTDNPLVIKVRRDGVVRALHVNPVKHCGVNIILKTNNKIGAFSDGRDVAITTGLMAFVSNEDELALAVGHEFGHAIGAHFGKVGLAERRRREDQADTVGIRLVACGGYDPAKALELYKRLASRDRLAFLRAPTHRKFRARIELMLSALAQNDRCSEF